MESPETAKTIERHPVDELTAAYQKFNALTTLSIKEQYETFIERFIFMLSNEKGLMKVEDIRTEFEAAIKNQGGTVPKEMAQRRTSIAFLAARRKASVVTFSNFFTRAKPQEEVEPVTLPNQDYELELNSTAFSEFLEKAKKPMPPLQRRNGLLGVLCPSGGISLLGYLLYHYRRPILRQYYERRNIAAPRKVFALQCGRLLGHTDIGYQLKLDGANKLVGEALVEELMLRHPLGVDELLDAGMLEFNKVVEPYRQSIFDLQYIISSPESSQVKMNSAKSELPNMRKCYAEAYQTSYTKMKKRIADVRAQQKEHVQLLKRKVQRSRMHRAMTLSRQ